MGRRALVVGDLMLDEYIFGRATRISQEAPVMVVKQTSTRAVPGGAANVAANIVAMGGSAALLGVVGDDIPGKMLESALSDLPETRLIVDPSRPTTRKLRVLANHAHQVLRIDHEEERGVEPLIADQIIKAFRSMLPTIQVVLISDYQKGCVTQALVEEMIVHCRQCGVPVVANPKPRSLPSYRGAALVSLNRFEAGEALNGSPVVDEEAVGAAERLRDKLEVERVLVTLGGSGLAAAGANTYRVPAIKVDLYDEAGAGDTVIATVALGIAAGHFGNELLELATRTAGAVVQKVGVAVPSPEDLQQIEAL
jgi:D-beta-D-heptose 7-phosphate kinase/D-beta-D-heptose 1-phosphate adenosyltransferase